MTIQILSAMIASSSLLAIFLFFRASFQRGDELNRLPQYEDAEAATAAKDAIARIFSARDRYFIRLQSGFRPELEKRLITRRKRAMSLYLKQHYIEFRRLMSTASETAREADGAFGADLMRLSLRFHLLYAVIWAESHLLGHMFAPAAPERIVAIVQGLRADIAAHQATMVRPVAAHIS